MAKRAKPTGIISQDRLSPQSIETVKMEFPKTKEEIETLIAELYLKELSKLGETIEGLELNDCKRPGKPPCNQKNINLRF